MSRLNLKKIRAMLSTGLAGSGVGALLGAATVGVLALLGPGTIGLLDIMFGAFTMGAFGFLAVGGVAAMLVASPIADSLDDLPLWKCAAMGFLSGSLFPSLGALLTGGLLFPLELGALAGLAGFFGVLGGGVAAGLVAVAKDAPSGLLAPEPAPLELPAEE